MIERKRTADPPNDVPVVIDSMKREAGFEMTRCNYLSVECDEPRPGWQLEIGGDELPFLMLGLMGIIQRPFGGETFDTPEQIEGLFRRIEDEAGLLVDVNDIWLPNFLLFESEVRPQPGNVIRVRENLFALAYRFRDARLDADEFIRLCHEQVPGIRYLVRETAAFKKWHAIQLATARDQYPKNRDFLLRWEDSEENSK